MALLLPLALASGCSAGGHDAQPPPQPPVTIVVDGETVEVAPLFEAVSGLCQARQEARTDGRAAMGTYARRSRFGVDTTTRILERSNAFLAGAMTSAVARVQAGLAADPVQPSVEGDLARLTELMREGLARLGVTTSACPR